MTTTSPSRTRRLLTGLLAGVAVLSATSCSADTESPRAGAGGAGGSSASAGATPSGAVTADPGPAPLDAFLGFGGTTKSSVGATSAYRRYEEEVARCMAKEGFEYVPSQASWSSTEVGLGTVSRLESAAFPDLPPDEFAAQFGYGHSTAPDNGEQSAQADPNGEIVDAMSVAERVAYYRALYGAGTPLTADGNLSSEINISDDSCSGKAGANEPTDVEAEAAVRKQDRVRKAFASLLQRVGDLHIQENEDPRVAAATREWSSCMAAAGFAGFADIDDARGKSLGDARALLGRDLVSKGVDPTRLAALRRTEIRLAVADLRCRIAWDKTFLGVQRELEERFVKANLSELKKFRSAMSAARR